MIIKETSKIPRRYIIDSNYRLTLYSPTLVRAEYSGQGIFDDDNPLILEPDFSEDVPHEIRTTDFFELETEYFRLSILPNGRSFDIGNLFFNVFNSFNGPRTFEPGVTDNENLGGAMLDLYKYPHGKFNEKFTEGLLSKNGYFVFRNHCEFLWDERTKWIKKRSDWDFQDWYLFGYGTDYKKAFKDFICLFGKIPLPPRYAFGYWYSRWHKFSDTDIIEVIKKIRSLGVPLDVFVIDTDWRKHGWNGYEWNGKYFPSPAKFISELKKMNVKCCLNDHPGYGVSDELPADDPYREKIKKRIPDIKEYRIRWNDERYVNAWSDEIFTKILDDGVDFWWVDGWGATDGIMDLHSQLWLNKFYFDAAKKTKDNRRPMILSRWGGLGSHRYPVQFSGDTYSTFETLKQEISFTHKGGNIGACYWSHDIGGFLGGVIPEDLFIRWVQFGCFSPVFRTHSSGASRDIWNYSTEALEVFRKYTKIRYALNPYFYGLARKCHDTGLPVVRGLYIEYPGDKRSYEYNEEYLIGRDILVSPAYGGGQSFKTEIYFPPGDWIALEDNDIIKGPATKAAVVPLSDIPVYIRKGAIIPTYPVGEYLPDRIAEIEFTIYPNGKSDYVYYEDDGNTEGYLRGEFLRRRVSVSDSPEEISIKLSESEGGYPGAAEKMNIAFNVFSENMTVKAVFVDGKECGIKHTSTIFSGTVKSSHKFLKIDIEGHSSDKPVEIIIVKK